MIRRHLPLLAVVATLVPCATAAAQPSGSSAVVEWNRIALQTTARAPFNPPRETRSVAIVQAAVLDAVTSITQARPPYLVRVAAMHGASLDAAVASAAHRSLAGLYPDQRPALDDEYARALAKLDPGKARDAGAAIGDAVASAVLALRADDGSDVPASFDASAGPGRWVPTPPGFLPALEPGWGGVTPFLLPSGSALRPPPPPALTSRRYARDLHEIATVGASDSADRTPDQTAAARFWVATAPQLWNQAVQQIVVRRRMSGTRAAHAFALLNLAGADAFIAAWDAKLAYLQWRPVTAIGATSDPDWTPLLVTPPFPDYPAAHTTFAGAAETVLTALLGDAPEPLTLTSPIAPAQRGYAGFREIADEVENARVWGGVHWRSSSEAGRDLGRRIGCVALRRLG
jgi:PAP2 superfamily